jgi:septum site-determining protein MinC
MSPDLANKSPVFQLKASLYTLTTLHLLLPDLEALNEQLAKLRKQAPKFFDSAPVIVDFQRLEEGSFFNFIALKNIFSQHQLIIVGLRHVPASFHTAAKEAGFAILPNATQSKTSGAHSTELGNAKPLRTKTETAPEPVASAPAPAVTSAEEKEEAEHSVPTMVISSPVRSGQQIYAKDADLVVINSVSPGAEIIADGNIHVYGTLKGRALAGAKGNTEARIFCQNLAAELVSIAGHYWLHEDVIAHLKGKSSVQIFLKNDQLQLEKL